MNTQPSITVGELVAEMPARAKVFEQVGIDYCCGGKQSFSEACEGRGLDPAAVMQLMETPPELVPSARFQNVEGMPLEELVDHIEATHHVYLRETLPALAAKLAKVEAVHAENHPELHEVRAVYESLVEEISAHMWKEEEILFPAIRALSEAKECPEFHCGSLANPISVMESEHESAGFALSELSRLTKKYTLPADACATYAEVLRGLEDLEQDLHQHVHKENNVLFPRVIARERESGGAHN